MKVKPIKRQVTATALTNPDPSFVTLCKGVGGANQEPFRAIRTEDNAETEAAPMKFTKAKASSAVAAIARAGFGVMQFKFDKNTFKTADDVKSWLDEGGYSDYEIVETAKTFEVSDSDGKYEVGSISVVKSAQPGVDAFVGKIAGMDEGEEAPAETVAEVEATGEGETAQRTEERPEIDPAPRQRHAGEGKPGDPAVDAKDVKGAKKPKKKDGEDDAGETAEAGAGEATDDTGDGTAAERTEGEEAPAAEGDGGTVAEVAAEAPEGVAAAMAKIDEFLSAHPDVNAKRSVHAYTVSDVASAVCSLRYIIMDADYSGIDDATVQKLKDAAVSAAEAMVALASQLSAELATILRTEAPAEQAEQPAPEGETNTADLAEAIRVAVEAAVAPVRDELAAASQRIEDANAEASEARTAAEEAKRELAERVAADESRSQSRRAAEDLATTESAEPVRKERCQASQTMLSAFGSRHARG